jgi:hypothetical protein
MVPQPTRTGWRRDAGARRPKVAVKGNITPLNSVLKGDGSDPRWDWLLLLPPGSRTTPLTQPISIPGVQLRV